MKSLWLNIWRASFVLTLMVGFVVGANITIDDANGRITYSSGWSVGNTCTACVAQPNEALTYASTWHDTTRDSNSTAKFLEYSFEGTAIYIYGININIVRTDVLFTTTTNLTLYIDGNRATAYQHPPLNRSSYEYNVPMFSVSGLSPSSHVARVELEEASVFLFDYLVYSSLDVASTSSRTSRSPNGASSSPQGSSSATNSDVTGGTASSNNGSNRSSSKTNVGAIVGAIFGVGALLILIGVLLFCLKRRKRGDPSSEKRGQQPYAISTGPSETAHVPPSYMAHEETTAMMGGSNVNQHLVQPYSLPPNSSAYTYGNEKERRGYGAGSSFQMTPSHSQSGFSDQPHPPESSYYPSSQYQSPPLLHPQQQQQQSSLMPQGSPLPQQDNVQRDTMGRPIPAWALGLPNDGRTTYMPPPPSVVTTGGTENGIQQGTPNPSNRAPQRRSSFQNLLPTMLTPRTAGTAVNTSDYSTSSSAPSEPSRQTAAGRGGGATPTTSTMTGGRPAIVEVDRNANATPFSLRPGSVPPPYPESEAFQDDGPVPPVPPVPLLPPSSTFPTALEEKRALSGR